MTSLEKCNIRDRVNDIICKSRIYKCLGCSFVGIEEKALDHQCECDSPMELIA